MPLPPRVCPECREEYVHSTLVCVHCDVALVHADEVGSDAVDELPPISELHCVRAASVGWALGLSERLGEAGIPHRVEAASEGEEGRERRPGRNLPYGVYVRSEDLAAASEIDLRTLREEIPDLPEGFEMAEGAEDACPACGEPVDVGAPECPGCGLALGGEE
jgi:hypothetical protein